MRYAVISKGLSLDELQRECIKVGAANLRVAEYLKQVFCDLDEAQAEKLRQVPGLAVKSVGQVSTQQYPSWAQQEPIYGGSQATLSSLIWEARNAISPPLTGEGYTIAIMDTGIRKTHRGLRGKIVYEADFTGSNDPDDRFDHGTGVAFMAAGGRPLEGEEQGVAPGAHLMNIKTIGDDGKGDEENVILGIEELIRLRQTYPEGDPLRPNIINMSFGGPDDGDADNPIRLALHAAADAGMGLVAAAGNYGPSPNSVTSPSVDPWVCSVGVMLFRPFEVWARSGRGPTKEGLIKPDLVFFGVDVLTASAKSDDAFVVKSGTSFAAPCISGVAILGREAALRVFGEGARGWGYEQMASIFPVISRKPAGAPLEKDNTYGFGMPFGDLMARQFVPSGADAMADMMQVMGMAFAGTMMIGLVEGVNP